MNDNTLLILYSPYSKAATFIAEGIHLPNVEVLPLTHQKNKLRILFFHLFRSLRMNKMAAYFGYEKECYKKLLHTYKNILCLDCCKLNEYKVIKSLANTSNELDIFFWNPLSLWEKEENKLKKKIMHLKEIGFKLSTFDFQDATKYNLELRKNINRRIDLGIDNSTDYDFYFVGTPKGRKNILQQLSNFLSQKGFKIKFIIVESPKDYITQIDNIRFSSKTKCIVDINASNQTGLTLRPFDALFLKKKLLTNNANIINTDFYEENNIYIFNENNMNGILKFMTKPYKEIPDKIVNQYEINQWLIDNFIHSDKN